MIELHYESHAGEALQELRKAAFEAVARCTLKLWEECTRAVGVPNPPPYKTPSLPGEPPRLRTAWGQRNIAYELDRAQLTGRVGVRVSAAYMAFLDRGTARVKARPWLLATARRIYHELQALAGRRG